MHQQVEKIAKMTEAEEVRDKFIASNELLTPALVMLDSKEISAKQFHNRAHTLSVMTAAIEIFTRENGLNVNILELNTDFSLKQDLEDLLIAVAYHDLGIVEGPQEHEERSVNIMQQSLAGKLADDRIEKIGQLIQATKMEPNSHGCVSQVEVSSLLEQIMQDADMSNLGKSSWEEQEKLSASLYQEVGRTSKEEVEGGCVVPIEWSRFCVKVFESHQYNTKAAQEMWNKGKAANLEELRRLVRDGDYRTGKI